MLLSGQWLAGFGNSIKGGVSCLNFAWMYGLSFLVGVLITCLLLPGLLRLIEEAGFLRSNYRGDAIPAAAGLIFFLVSPVIAGIYVLFFGDRINALVFFSAAAAFTCLGLIDDVWGSRDTGGLAGHLRAFLSGRLTTGALKALAGLVIAIFVSAMVGSWQWIPLNALVIALSANAINLLDLRPGRAGKGFILLALIFLVLGWSRGELFFLTALLGSLIIYLRTDLKARAMMGDAGSNPLGAVLGISAIWMMNELFLLIYLFLLILFHLFTEKYSLTGIIAGNRVLDYLDRLGRG